MEESRQQSRDGMQSLSIGSGGLRRGSAGWGRVRTLRPRGLDPCDDQDRHQGQQPRSCHDDVLPAGVSECFRRLGNIDLLLFLHTYK